MENEIGHKVAWETGKPGNYITCRALYYDKHPTNPEMCIVEMYERGNMPMAGKQEVITKLLRRDG